mgnify:CR=1 FL=1
MILIMTTNQKKQFSPLPLVEFEVAEFVSTCFGVSGDVALVCPTPPGVSEIAGIEGCMSRGGGDPWHEYSSRGGSPIAPWVVARVPLVSVVAVFT